MAEPRELTLSSTALLIGAASFDVEKINHAYDYEREKARAQERGREGRRHEPKRGGGRGSQREHGNIIGIPEDCGWGFWRSRREHRERKRRGRRHISTGKNKATACRHPLALPSITTFYLASASEHTNTALHSQMVAKHQGASHSSETAFVGTPVPGRAPPGSLGALSQRARESPEHTGIKL